MRSAAKAEGKDPSTILRWTEANETFSQQYARARDIGYKLLGDEIVSISDEADYEPVPGADGESKEVRFDATAVARNRLRVDSRKWMLSKMLPKLYGDKTTVEGPGPNGEHKMSLVVEFVRPTPRGV